MIDTTTNRELFGALLKGQYVAALQDNDIEGDRYGKYMLRENHQYIWSGTYEVERGNRRYAKVVEAQGRNIRLVDLEGTTSMRPVFTDMDETPRVATEYEQFLIVCLVNDEAERVRLINRFDEKVTEINALREDFVNFNEALNKYATDQGWCSDFDNVTKTLNESMTQFQLVGRTRKYRVSYEVTATYEGSVEVEATSEDEARDQLTEDFDDSDLLREARDQDSYPSIMVGDTEASLT